MALAPGTRVGAYEIVAPLGAGGMGEVYRARDSRLGRAVALKTLPPEFAADPDRRARFEREAKTLATLNHPHIAQIYGLEEVAGEPPTLALAMELVEGEDLASRLTRGPVPPDEVWPLARQIAEGLEAAHEAGIVHRDLKPANIRVTADGVAKVLDFGLAKPLSAASAGAGSGNAAAGATHSPTIMTSPAMTLQGVILGTAPYMSPEQAKGRAVDRRADIWAFGCVLYELLTGRRAFDGDDVPEILGAILKTEPDWARLPAATPARIRTLLQRCVAKDKAQRLQHIGDARLELGHPNAPDVAAVARPPATTPWWWLAAGAAIGGVVVLALSWTRATTGPGDANESAVLRFTLPIPVTRLLGPSNFAVSPDGRAIAFAAPGTGADTTDYNGLHVRALDSLDARQVSSFLTSIRAMAWSPDSRRLVVNGGGLRLIDVATGATQPVASPDAGIRRYGLAWDADGTILHAAGPTGLTALSGTPLEARDLPRDPADTRQRLFPSFLPNGRRYVYVARQPGASSGEVCIADTASSAVGCLGLNTPSNVQIANGALLYLAGRDLIAQPVDATATRLSGNAVRLATDIATGYVGLGAFSASHNGVLAYRTGASGTESLVWFDRTGTVQGEAAGARVVLNFDLSRDGSTVADTDGEKLFLTDLRRSVTTQSTAASGGSVFSPVLSTDGTKVAVAADDPTKLSIFDVAGSAAPRVLDRPGGVVEDWSPDDRWIAVTTGWLVDASGGPAVRFATVPSGVTLDEIEFSPDGRWLTYNLGGAALGAAQVFVSPASGSGERWQISTSGGVQGRWSPRGDQLYYLAPNGDMMSVGVAIIGGRPSFAPPVKLFSTDLQVSAIQDQFKVAPDGRFLISRPRVAPGQESVTVIVNWPALLKPAAGTP